MAGNSDATARRRTVKSQDQKRYGAACVDRRAVLASSRDNLPNPVVDFHNPYVPLNTPAIGDLFDLFDFSHTPGGWQHAG